MQHASTGRLEAAAVEGGASQLAVGPSDVLGQQQPLLGVDGLPSTGPDEAALQQELTNPLQDQEQEEQNQEQEQNIATDSGSSGDDKPYVACELVQIEGENPAAINLQLKNAARKDGIRLRKSGILVGSITGKAMHDYVEAQGWKSYIVCATSAESSMALIVDPGGKRVHPPEVVQQKMLDEELAGVVRKMLASPRRNVD